jgi:hypothetical protein
MSISMGVIVIAVLVFVGLEGGFSFSPGKATGGSIIATDVVGQFSTAGRTSGFAVVVPKGIPKTWQGSSFSITQPPGTPDAPPTVRGGWQTPSGSYITLIESSGSVNAVLAAELNGANGSVTGSVTAGGAEWAISPGVRQEVAWSRTDGAIVLLITGNATPAEFQQLAVAVAG